MSVFRKKKAAESVLKQAPKDHHLPLPDVIYVAETSSAYPYITNLKVFDSIESAVRYKIKGRKVATYRLIEVKCYELVPQEVPCDKN